VCDTGDFFHESIPDGNLWDALDVLAARVNVTWQILTKRAVRMKGVVDEWLCRMGLTRLPDHIWRGVTVENQARAYERIPALLATAARRRFVSCEPLLEPVNLQGFELCPNCAPRHIMNRCCATLTR
jgi:protein gp37